ncbi:hypothetical protein BS47DRAFT_500970 [Hydnum rufescens UP504]|uniref:Uncharacterized protein n=1 Tax=Hydnum rufescens UP504 TaxID=1448309 RepID=A0A9P6B5V1_9AGAM|nr:hypothetical protein BS47DRAFT_500970 [Hydnum rufescens UP504]
MAQLRSESKSQLLLHQKAKAQTLLDRATINKLKACLTEAEHRHQQDESLIEDLRRERDRLCQETSQKLAESHGLRSAHGQLVSSSFCTLTSQEHLPQVAGSEVQSDLDPPSNSRLEVSPQEFHLTEPTTRSEQIDSCVGEHVDNRSPHTVADKGAHKRQATVYLQAIPHLEAEPDRRSRRLDPEPQAYTCPEPGDDTLTPQESHRSQPSLNPVATASTDRPPKNQAPTDIEDVLRAIVLQTVQERDAARHACQTAQAELEIAKERARNLQLRNSELLTYDLDPVELRRVLAHTDQVQKTDRDKVTYLKQYATILGDQYSRRNKELETLLEEQKHKIQTQGAELQDLRLGAQDHESREDQAQDNIEQVLRAILLQTVQERDAANINAQNAEAQLNIANENVAKLETSCSELRKYETTVGELEIALARTQQEWANYRAERDGNADSLKQEMASLRHEHDKYIKERDACVAEQLNGMTTHEADLRTLRLSLDEAEESRVQLQKSMSRVEDELRSVQEHFKDTSSELETFRLGCAELSSLNAGLAEQIASLEAYKDKLELEVELQNFALEAGYIHDEQHLCRLKVPGFAKGLIKLQRLADAVLESRPKENSTATS